MASLPLLLGQGAVPRCIAFSKPSLSGDLRPRIQQQHCSERSCGTTFRLSRLLYPGLNRRWHHNHPVMQASRDNSLPSRSVQKKASSAGTGVFLLLVVNLALFAADKLFRLPWLPILYLHTYNPRWWQFVTAAFCHYSWDHLSSNLFMLYTFGKIVEEEEGSFAVWLTYVVCALGASVASFLFDKGSVSLGASGAVFGLFAVAVLLKLKFSFQKLVECLVLGQFVVKQVLQEVQSAQAGGLSIGGAQVGHIAHLGGALMGVLLILALSRLPEVERQVASSTGAFRECT